LDILPELRAGRGFIDIMMLVRRPQGPKQALPSKNSVPILLEIKRKSVDVPNGMVQIEAKGYGYTKATIRSSSSELVTMSLAFTDTPEFNGQIARFEDLPEKNFVGSLIEKVESGQFGRRGIDTRCES
jgi:hypothetical protein